MEINSKLDEILGRRYEVVARENCNDHSLFLKVFAYCVRSLTIESKVILENCFIDKKFEYWWTDKYSQTTFYRKRNQAITSFVNLFNFIYENINDYSSFINNVI